MRSLPMNPKIALVVLAAGASRRMGKPKQLLSWGTDILINHVIQEALQVPCDGHYVILGAHAKLIAPQLPHGIDVFIHENWEIGLGSSIAFAIKNLPSTYDAVQFMLVDQPQVDAPFLIQMQQNYVHQNHALIASIYQDSIGIPALFDKRYFTELMQLTNSGAKSVLTKLESELYCMHPPLFFEDLDTLAQYVQLYTQTFGMPPPQDSF